MEKNLDEYLDCENYKGHTRSAQHQDFSTFEQGEKFYFAMLDDKGGVALRSEGYISEKGRDNGIESVIKNRAIDERWKVIEETGKHYLSLIAGNHQEVARSCGFDSDSAARAANKGGGIIVAASTAAAASSVGAAVSSDRRDDDYLVCSGYEGHSAGGDGFSRFTNGGEFFFAMIGGDGAVKLRSERYTSESGRDNGIESVKKNRELSERYKIEEARNIFYVVLKAGNHQEIGRSCPYTDRGAAVAFIADPIGLKAAAEAKAKAEAEAREAAAAKAKAEADAKAAAEAKAAADAKATQVAAAAAIASQKAKQDDYLKCSEYKGHSVSSIHNDFTSFSQDGEHFFTWIGRSGEVILRSERYQSEKARDNGIESVIKNRKDKSKWSVDEKMGYYFSVLKAGNHQEIGRSCPSKDKAAAGWNPLWFAAPVAAAVAAAPKAKQDDYLKCAEYKGHKRSSLHKDFVAFDKGGEYFFAWIGKDGDVVLRSERYQSAKARDNGIESVLKNRKEEKRWSVDEKMGYYFSVLKAGNHQEIGRSCPSKDKAAAGWNPLWFAAPVAAVAAAIPKTKPTPPKVEKKVVAAAAPIAEATSSGSGWWKWLLGAALLALLAWFLCCKSCNKTPAPVVVPPVVETPAPVVEAPPPAPVAAVCNCNSQTHPVFKLPSASFIANRSKAKNFKLSRLGTYPEFKDSHGLDGAGFYNKLKTRHSVSNTDKRFLDGIFKAMGYANGFADAEASMFSEVELPKGTRGNLGEGPMHRTKYHELPDSSRDRQAFKIEAANGCHLHFMKTCGNHMFFCPN